MKLLLIDDEPDILQLLAEFLEFEGHEVACANNGDQGWLLFSQNVPQWHAILVDAKMPVMDGLEMLRRTRESGHQTPIIIITGHADDELAAEALSLGASAVCSKPFDLDQLTAALDRCDRI